MSYICYQSQKIATDDQGYLKKVTDWNDELAVIIAAGENIVLTQEHWEIIRFIRNFYLEFKTSPAMRILVKAISQSLGVKKANSKYLYRLFPMGPAKQASKIAGIPKPVKCI